MEMVTTVSFEITTYDYASPDYGKWTFPHDFHYVYILENGRDAYVGETNAYCGDKNMPVVPD